MHGLRTQVGPVNDHSRRTGTSGRAALVLVRALGLAHHWQKLLDEEQFDSMTEIAAAEEMDLGQVSKIVRLACLAPDIVDACVTGAIPSVTLERFKRRAIPTGWTQQRERLGPA